MVKPFILGSTPSNNKIRLNFIANSGGECQQFNSSENPPAAANGFDMVSASKNMGTHLLQVNRTPPQNGVNTQYDLLSLLSEIGQAVQAMQDCDCATAITLFKKLPKQHLLTGWVQGQIAKCYFEI